MLSHTTLWIALAAKPESRLGSERGLDGHPRGSFGVEGRAISITGVAVISGTIPG